VTPNLKLVDQVLDTIDRYNLFKDIPHSRMIVASKTNRTEPITTNPELIADFFDVDGGSSNDNDSSPKGMRFIICTYVSLGRVGEGWKLLQKRGTGVPPTLDYAVFDEAHNMEGVGKNSGYGLYDDLLPVDRRLFMTGTPRRYNETVSIEKILGSKVSKTGSAVLIPKGGEPKRTTTRARSFDDETLFGPCIFKRTYRESTEQNITVPITMMVVDRTEVHSLLGVGVDLENLSPDELKPLVLAAAFTKLDVKHAVSFHSTNARARAFVEQAKPVLGKGITALSVDGTMGPSKREAVLSLALNSPKSVVSNCKLLSTGVDEAHWDLVYMADNVRSVTQVQQMIGRVSRPAPNKERGYVLVPLAVDSDVINAMRRRKGG
jgi:predicted helicase